MKKSRQPGLWAGIAFLLVLYFAPAAIGAIALRSSWRGIAIAYAIWLGALILFSLWPGSGRWRDKVGWAVGIGMFLTTPAVLILLLLLSELAGID